MTQPSFFERTGEGERIVGPKARNTDPSTSHSAAASMEGGARTQRAMIHNHLRKHGPMTADALDEALMLRLTSAGRRLSELAELGHTEALEETAPTRSGRAARLWRATNPEEISAMKTKIEFGERVFFAARKGRTPHGGRTADGGRASASVGRRVRVG